MSFKNYSNFIHFSPNTMGTNGRHLYIDPNLITDFINHVNPATTQGKNLANKISVTMAALAGGNSSGKAIGKPNEYFIDISSDGMRSVRVYYTIFQDKVEGVSKGGGAYIYDLKPLKGLEDKEEGLYKVKYKSGIWDPTYKPDNILDEKLFFIGAYSDSQKYSPDQTASSVGRVLDGKTDKSNFNMYYSPEYLLNNGEIWEIPKDKVSQTASSSELADIFIKSEDKWQTGNHGTYKTTIFGESAKVFVKALEIVAQSGTQLTNHEFEFKGPHENVFKIKNLVESVGGKLTEMSFTDIQYTKASLLHQSKDAREIVSTIRTDISNPNTLLQTQTNRTALLSNRNITFFELVLSEIS